MWIIDRIIMFFACTAFAFTASAQQLGNKKPKPSDQRPGQQQPKPAPQEPDEDAPIIGGKKPGSEQEPIEQDPLEQNPGQQNPGQQNPGQKPPRKPIGGKYDQKGAQQIEQDLKQFQQDSKAFMNRHLQKYNDKGKPTKDSFYSEQSQTDMSFVQSKYEWRQNQFFKGSQKPPYNQRPRADFQPYAEIANNDRPETLLESSELMSDLQEMENLGLRRGRIEDQPWSGDYWPYYQGAIGARHFDPQFPLQGADFLQRLQYVNSNFFLEIFGRGNQDDISQLSASEKYDLIVGDTQGGLTDHVWSEGKRFYEQLGGRLEEWMGYCHGWAPASYMLKRPSRSIQVTGYDGRTQIKLFPSDIKGLASYLWATSPFQSRFIGGRCNVKKPQTDEAGRILDQNCSDTNAGTWHLAVVNQVGYKKRSFIMDATYDYEVWNQPVVSYEYVYFNPQSFTYARGLQDAIVSRDEFTNDKFARYRSQRAAHVVGIVMKVTYLVESSANSNEYDSPQYDQHRTVNYYYDLELDQNGQIIGGEWYTNRHPDFLWTPTQNARAMAAEDRGLTESWDGRGPAPQSWRRAAQRASSRGEALATVVETLIEFSSSDEERPGSP
ncbi:MAG TPA: hypothetical protein VFV50_05920 [Bdellovibrionales bacterium]|nr:hypothetical protein [Bdellovibrionales bacterium]